MNHLQNRTIAKRKSALLFENMIIERIGRHEVLLPINQNNEKFEKQQLIRRNAQHQRAHDAFCPLTQAWRIKCPITLTNQEHDAYIQTVLLVLKSGW